MVGESFHPRGCWGEDSDHIRLGATVQKLLRLFAFGVLKLLNLSFRMWSCWTDSLMELIKRQGNSGVSIVIETVRGQLENHFSESP